MPAIAVAVSLALGFQAPDNPATDRLTKLVAPAEPAIPVPSPQDLSLIADHHHKTGGRLTLSTIDFSPALDPDERFPNWFVYHGVKVPLRRRAHEIMLTMDQRATLLDVRATLASAGVQAAHVQHHAFDGEFLITLIRPTSSAAQHNAIINAILKDPSVRHASPCFDDQFGAATRVFVTQHVLAASNHLQAPVPGLITVQDSLALVPGGMIFSAGRNGFDTIRAANSLSATPGWRFAEPRLRSIARLSTIPNDPFFPNAYHLRSTIANDYRAWRAWNYATGSGVRVLVMDTGSQQDHPDLNQMTGRNFVNAPAAGNGDGSPVNACDDHGTAVAGVISAAFNNNLGVAGVAPNSRTLAARIGAQAVNPCSSTFAEFDPVWMVNAIAWGRASGCRITNASLSAGAVSNALDESYRVSYEQGMIHFAASGNGGVGSVSYPASIAYVNAVGGLSPSATRVFNWGEGLAFTGPAQSIATTDRTGTPGYGTATVPDYATPSGTSFAAPGVAGVAALIMSAHPTLTGPAVESAMRTTAVDLGTPSYDTSFGWGRPDAHAAIRLPGPANDHCESAIVINTLNFSTQAYVTYATASREEATSACEAVSGGPSHSVWFRFEAPADGTLDLSTIGSDYDTVLSVFSACSLYFPEFDSVVASTVISCNDDADGLTQARIPALPLMRGQSIVIKVSRYAPAPTTSPLRLVFQSSFSPTVPAHNTCFAARELAPTAPVDGEFLDNTFATSPVACSHDSPAGCADSAKPFWFKYTAQQDGYLSLWTDHTGYDTVLSVHTGCGWMTFPLPGQPATCQRPAPIACNDDASPTTRSSRIDAIPMRAGTTFLIRVGGYRAFTGNTASGTSRLHWLFDNQPIPGPAGDDCASPRIIPEDATTFTDAADAAAATVPAPCGDPPWAASGSSTHGPSLWWSFTPPAPGLLTLDTIGSTFDTVLIVHGGCTTSIDGLCTHPGTIAGNDDFDVPTFGRTSRINALPVQPGAPLLIRVSSFGSSTPGSAVLNLTFEPTGPTPPPNDACAAAQIIPDDMTAHSSVPVDSRAATSADTCTDQSSGCEPDALVLQSVWYTYTPQSSGLLWLDTAGSTYDTLLALYVGTEGCNPTDPDNGQCIGPGLIACNNDADLNITTSAINALPVAAGGTLLIRVTTSPGDPGGLTILNARFTTDDPPPPVCAADIGQQGGTPGSDQLLDNNDFVVFIDFFFTADPRADLGQQGGVPGPDGLFDNNDFVAFIDAFFAGCP